MVGCDEKVFHTVVIGVCPLPSGRKGNYDYVLQCRTVKRMFYGRELGGHVVILEIPNPTERSFIHHGGSLKAILRH